ncbi:PIR Superfamily Protein [Plasmodium ovale wallikeri]|uniref:PIR Superfamily Protein n=1 Tax=Plasmodium ovale wallikeri TaxID=864142 RepID=A0A1A9AKB2_PLAOA|nr:PIR Superfamily Protein [Plasmodium ovale wallikeri]SBT56657.1 PIR Superfamily Protein [Plasmodium ovale wallikeri]
MVTSRDAKHILSDNDLPANFFDDECNKRLNIETLNNVEDSKYLAKPIETWADEFKDKFTSYLDDKLNSSQDIDFRKKRCRDFNYWMFYVIEKIRKIVKEADRVRNNIDGIKEFAKSVFRENNVYGCSLDIEGTTIPRYIKKELDNFCENRDSFEKKLKEYDYTDCEKYKNYINMTINTFNSFIFSGATKDNSYLHISDECNFDKRCSIFPIIQCYSNGMVVTEHVETSENEPCKNIDAYLEAPGSSHTIKKILSVTSPIAGVAAFSLILYKMFPTRFLMHKMRSNFNPLENDFEQLESQDFLGPPNFLNNKSNDGAYQIAYHTA